MGHSSADYLTVSLIRYTLLALFFFLLSLYLYSFFITRVLYPPTPLTSKRRNTPNFVYREEKKKSE